MTNMKAFDLTSEPILLIDSNDRIAFANVASEKVLGLPQNFLGKHSHDALIQVPWLAGSIEKLMTSRKKVVSVYDDKDTLWQITSSPIMEEKVEGLSGGSLIVLHDTSVLKKTFDDISWNIWKHSISRHVSDRMFYFHDLNYKHLKFSGDIEKLTGYSPHELSGFGLKGLIELVHPNDRKLFASKIDEVLRTFTDINIEYRFKKKNGRYIHLSDTCTLITDPEDRPYKFLGTIKEITKRIEATEALQLERDAAEAANRAKTRFLGMLSHEMRTPLHSMKGTAEMMTETDLDERQKGYLSLFLRSCTILGRLIDDAFDLALMEEGMMDIFPEEVSIKEIIADIKAIYADSFKEKGLKFSIKIKPDVPEIIVTDRSRIVQILINIIGNAFKFTNSGSVVLSITRSKDGSRLIFNIKDTGIGIETASIESVFKPFSKLAGQGWKRHHGAGLGLTISKMLAELMGGQIDLKSKPGEGSIFSVNLPLITKTKKTGKTAHKAANNYRDIEPIKILAVDDVPENLELLQIFFEHTPVKLDLAASGEDAFEMFCSGKYECTLVDMHLPDMDGQDVVRAMRNYEKVNGLKRSMIIGISADARKSNLKVAVQAGCNVCLVKPVSRETLCSHIALYMGLNIGKMKISKGTDACAEPLFSQAKNRIIEYADEIINAGNKNGLPKAGAIGHAIKGLGMTFGLAVAEKAGRDIQKAALAGDSQLVKKLVSELKLRMKN